MNTKIKIHNDVFVSSIINEQIFTQFTHQLSKSIDSYCQADYSEIFTLDNKLSNGQSVLITPQNNWIHGSVVSVINWLRLIDIFVLRPHGCYLVNQHLNFNEFSKSSNPVVVTLMISDGNLITKFNIFSEDVNDVMNEVSIIPQEVWLLLVNRMTGRNFTTYSYMEDADKTGGVILKFYGPFDQQGFIIQYGCNDNLQYHYKPKFDLENFMNSVNTILKRLQHKN